MKKLIIIFLLTSFAVCSYSQSYTYRKSKAQTEWILLGSLPKTTVNSFQKLRIKIFGGVTTASSLAETTYTIATRGGVQVNMHRQGGTHDENTYKLKIYESVNSIDFVLEALAQWLIFDIESTLLYAEPNQITTSQKIEIQQYNPGSNKDVTETATIRIMSATAQNGHIGIGTNIPTAKFDVDGGIKGKQLDINGTIRSKEVKIEATGWSDFVFSEDYKLPALSEVESHIKEHKHLPDVPSEKQVIEEGVNVMEMQAKLLQKIEELTLYTIELEKKYNGLKEENEVIKKQINK